MIKSDWYSIVGLLMIIHAHQLTGGWSAIFNLIGTLFIVIYVVLYYIEYTDK